MSRRIDRPAGARLCAEVRVFAALGDATRVSILERLGRAGELSITRLSAGRAVTRQSIRKHLGVLARAGLVHSRRRGRERCFALAPAALERARRSLERIALQWDHALLRLKAAVEAQPGGSEG